MNYQYIDQQIDDILNGKRDLPQFNQPEHAGVCSAGSLLVGSLLVCNITRESLSASGNVAGCKGTGPSNWQIDEVQEKQYNNGQANLHRLHREIQKIKNTIITSNE